jgi:hypothetical protein
VEKTGQTGSTGFPGGAMTFVAINFFAAYALLLADDLISSIDASQ